MNKASGGDGIPAELVKILKGDAVKVYRLYPFNFISGHIVLAVIFLIL